VKPVFLTALIPVLIGLFAPIGLGQVGGYREVAVTDKDAIAAASFAIETQGKKEKVALVKIVKAEVQVVAGRNYRINMDVRVDGGVRSAQAIVWAKLDRTNQLTKWEWKGEVRPEDKKDAKPSPGKITEWRAFDRHDFQVDTPVAFFAFREGPAFLDAIYFFPESYEIFVELAGMIC
jgi:Aspartic acid proteinase inhibitor